MTLFLGPGGYFFGSGNESISTLLGSCVSLVSWLPAHQILSVSHVMLPKTPDDETKSLRYGDAMLERWLTDVRRLGIQQQDFQLALFGGSTRFYSAEEFKQSVGYKNIVYFRQELQRLGLTLRCEQTGGHFHRKLLVDAQTGRFWLQYLGDPMCSDYQEGSW
jgi:chemotaxis protein CheD